MRLIDADALIGEINKRIDAAIKWGVNAIADGDKEIKLRAEQAVATFCEASLTAKKLPTIDAVEVVHCQNCGNSTDMRNCGFDGDMRFCHKLKIVTSPDWYCAAGARNGAAVKEAEEALSEVQTFVEGKRKDEAIIQN